MDGKGTRTCISSELKARIWVDFTIVKGGAYPNIWRFGSPWLNPLLQTANHHESLLLYQLWIRCITAINTYHKTTLNHYQPLYFINHHEPLYSPLFKWQFVLVHLTTINHHINHYDLWSIGSPFVIAVSEPPLHSTEPPNSVNSPACFVHLAESSRRDQGSGHEAK